MKVIKTLWVGDRLSFIEQLSVASFLANDHPVEVYSYGPLEGLPDGAVLKDANEIVPKSEVYRSRNGRLTSFANYFRWILLDRFGGIWIDMDVICLKPFDFEDEVVFGAEDQAGQIGTALLGFPSGHPLARILRCACENVNAHQPIDTLKTVAKKTFRSAAFGNESSRRYLKFTEPGGPAYFTKFVNFYGYRDCIKPVNWFYPLPYWEWRKPLSKGALSVQELSGAYSIHLWNEIISKDPTTDKNNLEIEGTLLEELAHQYGLKRPASK